MNTYRRNQRFSEYSRGAKRKRNALLALLILVLTLCGCIAVFYISTRGENLQSDSSSPPPTHIVTASPERTLASPTPEITPDRTPDITPDIKMEETPWNLILVNKWNSIPDDYDVELTELSNGQLVDERIYPALQEMFDAARSEGVYPVVVSGYRSAEKQQRLMDEKISEYRAEGNSAEAAAAKAEAWVAVPGTSEHQLGIAVDINADGVNSAGHQVYEWLEQNAYKFGFICRYPAEKTAITGVANEPWHYRYVGIEAATEIQEQGVCLEEFLR